MIRQDSNLRVATQLTEYTFSWGAKWSPKIGDFLVITYLNNRLHTELNRHRNLLHLLMSVDHKRFFEHIHLCSIRFSLICSSFFIGTYVRCGFFWAWWRIIVIGICIISFLSFMFAGTFTSICRLRGIIRVIPRWTYANAKEYDDNYRLNPPFFIPMFLFCYNILFSIFSSNFLFTQSNNRQNCSAFIDFRNWS